MLYSLRAKTFWNSDRHFLSTNLKFEKKIKTNILLKISKITQKGPKLAKIRLKMVFSSSRGGGLGLAAIGSQTLLDPTPNKLIAIETVFLKLLELLE